MSISAAVSSSRAPGPAPGSSSFVAAKQPPRGPHVEAPPPPTQTAFPSAPAEATAKPAAEPPSRPEPSPASDGQQLDVKL